MSIAALPFIVVGGIFIFEYVLLNLPDPVDPSWTDANVKASLVTGDKIISAIEKYHAMHGKYPVSLDQLVPEELPSIEPPSAGEGRWSYSAEDGSDYGIGFYSTVPPTSWNYNMRHPHWWLISRKRL